ncbi:MAG: 5,10-methylenetetrahydrofolate reductase [Desulfuromonadaceae bacterium GWC2_58_13]|nr:MAG: 5,10-methylenetetrahydrofolate reductase [Desulfuromonadaceae bacterium GWC2_58_13]
MSRLEQQLAAGQFVVTAEIAPPKGIDTAQALEKARLMANLSAVNVTDNQGANMRMSPLAMAALLVRQGIEPILQLTCRDRNRMALQSDLLGAAALGLENLLLLSGDHARFGDHPKARSVFDLDSIQLMQTVRGLTEGTDMTGKILHGAPRFFAGAAVTPEAEPFELMFQKFAKKVQAGTRFFQTQAVYDVEKLERFMGEANRLGTPVLLGVLLLKSARMAEFLNRNIPGVRVPQALIDRLASAPVPLEEGILIAREMVGHARRLCQGAHLMTLGHEERIADILG